MEISGKADWQDEAGTLPSFRAQRTTVEDLWKPFATSYKADLLAKVPTDVPTSVRQWREEVAGRNFRYVEQRWNAHLKNVFGNKRAAMVTTDDLKDYILHRKTKRWETPLSIESWLFFAGYSLWDTRARLQN